MAELSAGKSNSSFGMFILIGFILSAITIAGAGFFYSMQSSGANSELPVLRADNTIFKFRPENPGGKNIPHQDSQVLKILEGLTEKDNITEKLRLPDAAPELPPVAIKKENNSEKNLVSSETIFQDNRSKTDIIDNRINLTNIIGSDNSTLISDTEQKQETSNNRILENNIENIPTISPASKPVLPKEKSSKETHKVQLAAFAKQEKASQQAAILMEKHKMRLKGVILEVTQIDTGSSGIYWRVITEPLRKELAISTCDLLKSAGQDCIVRKIRKEEQ